MNLNSDYNMVINPISQITAILKNYTIDQDDVSTKIIGTVCGNFPHLNIGDKVEVTIYNDPIMDSIEIQKIA